MIELSLAQYNSVNLYFSRGVTSDRYQLNRLVSEITADYSLSGALILTTVTLARSLEAEMRLDARSRVFACVTALRAACRAAKFIGAIRYQSRPPLCLNAV